MLANCKPEGECIPDDVATPDDLEAIKAARAEYAAGETVPASEIDWD